jgi:transcriptional regulator with XRE-family HTH domain
MADKKMSGRVLAEQIGMPQSVFSRRMTGELPFTVDQLATIAVALDVPVAGLVVGLEARAAA